MRTFSCILSILNSSPISAAGSETTAITLTFLLYHLLDNRQYWNRLCIEIRSKFQHPDEIKNSALLELPFLEALICESILSEYFITDLSSSTPTGCNRKLSTRSPSGRSGDRRTIRFRRSIFPPDLANPRLS